MSEFREEGGLKDEAPDEEFDEEGPSDPANLGEENIPAGEDRGQLPPEEGPEKFDGEDEGGQEEMGTREVVTPGQVLGAKSKDLSPGFGTVTDPKGNIISLYVGFMQKRGKYVNVIPFKGRYVPRVGDKVIGTVVDKNVVLWKLDINAPSVAILRAGDAGDGDRGRRDYGGGGGRGERGGPPQVRRRFDKGSKKDDTSQFNVGDTIIAKVLKYDRTTEPTLTTVGPELGQIRGGFLMDIAVPKIPRLIGKAGSMIKLLNTLTSCRLFVAQNGIVWIKGRKIEEERILIKAIKKIESEAHTIGLTDRVKEYVENEMKKVKA
ncbi:MAG: RNA-binding protein [Candidatus Lokiarchaeota archaeon]|nr:RNA-binding protein [Candidatus Lokiarchaeota archaeon]